MKPLKQQREIDRNGHIRRDDQMTPRTTSSRTIMEYDKWIQGIKSSGAQFGKPTSPSPGAWSSRILQSDSDDKRDQDPDADADADRSASPVLLLQNSGNASFPATRTQEIANYRKEMMEMVRGLPDGDFELTLQDIVEKKKEFKEVEPVSVSTDEKKETRRKKNQKKYVKRSHSIDTGLLTRMFLPLSIAVRRKSLKVRDHLSGKKDEIEIDEKKQVVNAKKKSKDEEWWRNNEFSDKGSSNSSSVGSSTSNGSNSSTGDNDHFSRNMTMKKSKCYCFRPGKSKAKSS